MIPALTPRIVAYCLSEEAVGLSAYLDSAGVWTWAGGIAQTGGTDVRKLYKDRPQTLRTCLVATVAMMEKAYVPAVDRAFFKAYLTEAQLAACLSFTWRNGANAIEQAQWVKAYLSDDVDSAKTLYMQWTDHGVELARATRERELFFDDVWPTDLRTRVFTASGPSYKPVGGTMIDPMPSLALIMGIPQ